MDVHRGEGGVGEQGPHVGAHAEEGHVAEVEQPGQAHDHVQPEGGRREHADGGEHPDPVGVAVLGEGEGQGRHRRRPQGHRPVAADHVLQPGEQSQAGQGERRPRSRTRPTTRTGWTRRWPVPRR